ncbi:GntR family transcriptional regulator [Ktedonosporobacter rubrisoli]|uniref:GntR family transcriptional regulator n=1 Tax=Ktedonosporobacter rubrisoli TaxID=2509675 RepID=A0A4P6JQF5_KTERU|nr:GntR family transcriptional regulator [Ktedonosporobacter rubrisoli]QBD77657.1 GntR family transcriptional regulator [Ktedonosporobacter rubrisoli]
MAIWLQVDIQSSIPIYVQLVEQIQHALEAGTILPGETLPSVRELASELSIAPNTIVKAYKELQRMGFTESRERKGTIVLGHVQETRRAQQQEALLEQLGTAVHDASKLGVSAEALQAQFEQAVQQFYPEILQQEIKHEHHI